MRERQRSKVFATKLRIPPRSPVDRARNDLGFLGARQMALSAQSTGPGSDLELTGDLPPLSRPLHFLIQDTVGFLIVIDSEN